MTSSRSEFVQNAIDSAIASRSIDVHEYLSGPRRPILEQPEPITATQQQDTLSSIPNEPVEETMAPVTLTLASVTQSGPTNEPDLQEAIDHATQNAVNAPSVDVYGYLEKTNPVAVSSENDPIVGDKQTPAQDTGLNQETLPLSDNIQNAIQSAVNSGGMDSQSFITKSIETAAEVPVIEAPATEDPTTKAIVTSVPTTETIATNVPTTEAIVTDVPTTEAISTEDPTIEAIATVDPTTEALVTDAFATDSDVLSSQNAAIVDSQDTSGDIIDESINNKTSDDSVPFATLSAIDDGAHEPQHSEVDSGRRSPVATSDFGNEIDNALENAINTNDNAVAAEDETPLPPPKDTSLESVNSETNPLDAEQTTDNKEDLKDATKAAAAAVGASVAAKTAGVASFASEKKDRLKSKVNETVDKVVDKTSTQNNDNEAGFTPVTDDPLSQPQPQETDISEQSISQEQTIDKPPPPTPIETQEEPTAIEPIESTKDTPPVPSPNDVSVPEEQPTPPEPVVLKEPAQPAIADAPEVPASAPEPPSKHHHHKLLPHRPGHQDEEKGKKCTIM
jgi:hypothetical protein